MNNGQYSAGPEVDDEQIDLGELLGVIIENRWLIALIAGVALFIGAFRAYTEVPIYRADGLLQIEDKSPNLSSIDSAYMFETYSPVNAEIEILRSRYVLGQVVDNLKLDIRTQPVYMPFIGEALARRMPASERPQVTVDTFDLPGTVSSASVQLVVTGAGRFDILDSEGDDLGTGSVGEPARFTLPDSAEAMLFVSSLQGETGQEFWVSKQSRASAIRALRGSVSVEEQGEWSSILSVSVQNPDPSLARDQVNEIANMYLRQNVERKSEEARQTLEFLREQLPIVRQNLEAAELELNNYRLDKGSIDLPMETQTILQTIVSVEAQINELRREREKVTLAFTEEHPTIIALDRQIGRMNAQLDDLNEQVRGLPSTQQELLGLIRDVEVNTELYTSLLATAQELRVVEAGTVGNVRIIDEAVRPTSPISPNRTRIMALALLMGGFVGVVLAFARKALHAGVEDPDLIEKHVNIPVYATIAHSKRQDRIYKNIKSDESAQAILATDAPNDPAIESLRNLRTALHFGMMDVRNNCLMVVGPSPGVGKSFVSVNLATVLTSNGKNVLVIDGDLRRGHLHEYLGLPRNQGLSEVISGEISVGDALHDTGVEGLTLMPTGTLPPNPAELLLHKRFADCLAELGPRYDHIIIDSPPILAVTDATIIGQMVGGVLMVLKAGQHPMREIETAVKRLRQANVNLRGLLFNDVEIHSNRYGAARYSYQYAYKKGDS